MNTKNNLKKKNFKKKNSINIKEGWTRFLERSSSRGIAVIRNGKVIGAGVNFAKMVGHNYKDVIGSVVIDFIAPEHQLLVDKNIKSYNEISYETFIQRKDGVVLPVVANGRYIPNSNFTIWMVAVKD